jgi:hypothetical protein
MKKFLLTLMLAAVLVLPFGSVALQETPEVSLPEAMDYMPGGVPAQTDALGAMTPAIHAAILATLNQQDASFDGHDALASWECLYNMLSLYGQLDERAVYEDEFLILPAEVAMDFAAALNADFALLGPLPAALSDRMTYNADEDSYRLVCGEDALSETRLDAVMDVGGQLQIQGTLVYLVDNSQLARFQVTLIPKDNLFGYVIAQLIIQ